MPGVADADVVRDSARLRLRCGMRADGADGEATRLPGVERRDVGGPIPDEVEVVVVVVDDDDDDDDEGNGLAEPTVERLEVEFGVFPGTRPTSTREL